MKTAIPYGKTKVNIEVDVPCQIMEPNKYEIGDMDEILSSALLEPIKEGNLSEFVKGSGRLLIIVTDATRSTPTSKVIEHIYPLISTHSDLRFLIATGIHREPTGKEMIQIFGKYFQEFKERICIHDANNEEQLVYMGTTSRGTEVVFNSLIERSDSIITINNVKPHYFAGFTGGRKSFLPGIASRRTIEMNHGHATSEAAQPMALKGNPVSEDMTEAAEMLDKRIFSIQTVMTSNRELYFAASGDLSGSFDAAVQSAIKLYSVPIREKANIVLTANPYPMDINLYQSQHALENGRLAIKSPGIMILVSACWDGVGNDTFLKLFDEVNSQDDMGRILEKGYKLGHHKVTRMMQMKQHMDIWAVTDLDDDVIRRCKLKPYHDVQKALDDAISAVISSGCEPSVLLMPSGGVTVPKIKEQ